LKKALLISAIASNQGKTLLSMALLHHFKNSVRPYKCGPDFIDIQFHEKIVNTPSINLDGYMMNNEQLKWIWQKYFDKDRAIVEGVMGYYDGMDKGSSAYDIAKILQIPTLLVIDGSGSYITISAILKGMKNFREDNTIKGVVLNKLSSQMHYELIKKHIDAEFDDIVVCGWIEKDLKNISSTHLGLDLKELDKLDALSKDILKHIELQKIESIMQIELEKVKVYPFKKINKKDEHCVVVKDKNFSFLYHDNLEYLKEAYKKVTLIDATKNEKIPLDADMLILVGGYVESEEAYHRIKDASTFKNSLIAHAKASKKIYAECAGLIYLGLKIDDKEMSGILPIEFKLTTKRERLGYYMCELGGEVVKGHAFHYSKIIKAPKTDIKLYKSDKKNAKEGGFKVDNIFATYLHTMWRVYTL
jgi:cobyrinic acid a,c-diamide synthase